MCFESDPELLGLEIVIHVEKDVQLPIRSECIDVGLAVLILAPLKPQS